MEWMSDEELDYKNKSLGVWLNRVEANTMTVLTDMIGDSEVVQVLVKDVVARIVEETGYTTGQVMSALGVLTAQGLVSSDSLG